MNGQCNLNIKILQAGQPRHSIGAFEFPSAHGRTEYTAIHGAITSKINPDTS